MEYKPIERNLKNYKYFLNKSYENLEAVEVDFKRFNEFDAMTNIHKEIRITILKGKSS